MHEPGLTRSMRARAAAAWARLTSTQRRRIVLGSLFAMALAARDLVLMMAAASMFALSEITPGPAPRPQLA